MAVRKTLVFAEFVVRQVVRWSGYGNAIDTIDDVGTLVRELGLAGGVKGVDARVRTHLTSAARDLEGTELWDRAQEAAARICDHANIEWQELVTDLDTVKAGLQPRIDSEAAKFTTVGEPQHLARDDIGKPAPQLMFREPEAKEVLEAFVWAGLLVLREEAINHSDFPKMAATQHLADHAHLRESNDDLADRVEAIWQQRQELADKLAKDYLDSLAGFAISDPDRAVERAQIGQFATQDQDRWWWWRAQPWAGKTSLMADLATSPPSGVTVAAFLTIGRESTADDRDDFFDRILPQLALIAGEQTVDRKGCRNPRTAAGGVP